MFYPEEFKQKVREVYPNRDDLNQLLECGSTLLGTYLKEETKEGIDLDEVISATSLDELKKVAEEQKRRNEIYEEWKEIKNFRKYQIYHT